MALINIEHGSLASSEVMNKNFLYLDDKIAESSDSIMTSISSILSNIATINTRLADLSENVNDYVEDFNTSLSDYKEKTKMLVKKNSMVPNWAGCYSISLTTDFTVPSNGFILALPVSNASGNIYVNEQIGLVIKQRTNTYDNASQLISIPVKNGDIVSSDATLTSAYFLPASEISIENF